MVFTRWVSSRIETTSAACQPDTFGTLITVVPLFAPRIAIAVVPVQFPEPGLVVLHEAQSSYPLGGLPEIEVRHQEACRASMLGCERLALVLPDDERLSFQQILYREVGRVAPVAKCHHVRRRWVLEPGHLEDAINGDAAPLGVELRPARHAVNIHDDLRRTERTKLFPAPRHDLRAIL